MNDHLNRESGSSRKIIDYSVDEGGGDISEKLNLGNFNSKLATLKSTLSHIRSNMNVSSHSKDKLSKSLPKQNISKFNGISPIVQHHIAFEKTGPTRNGDHLRLLSNEFINDQNQFTNQDGKTLSFNNTQDVDMERMLMQGGPSFLEDQKNLTGSSLHKHLNIPTEQTSMIDGNGKISADHLTKVLMELGFCKQQIMSPSNSVLSPPSQT